MATEDERNEFNAWIYEVLEKVIEKLVVSSKNIGEQLKPPFFDKIVCSRQIALMACNYKFKSEYIKSESTNNFRKLLKVRLGENKGTLDNYCANFKNYDLIENATYFTSIPYLETTCLKKLNEFAIELLPKVLSFDCSNKDNTKFHRKRIITLYQSGDKSNSIYLQEFYSYLLDSWGSSGADKNPLRLFFECSFDKFTFNDYVLMVELIYKETQDGSLKQIKQYIIEKHFCLGFIVFLIERLLSVSTPTDKYILNHHLICAWILQFNPLPMAERHTEAIIMRDLEDDYNSKSYEELINELGGMLSFVRTSQLMYYGIVGSALEAIKKDIYKDAKKKSLISIVCSDVLNDNTDILKINYGSLIEKAKDLAKSEIANEIFTDIMKTRKYIHSKKLFARV